MPVDRYTPDVIESLAANEIFVFGSNTLGIHGRGAALLAKQRFGAVHGIGEGLQGQSYAFPTLGAIWTPRLHLHQRTRKELSESADKFYACAECEPDLTFLLTKVGCGLAGYDEGFMKMLFRVVPVNVVKPEGW